MRWRNEHAPESTNRLILVGKAETTHGNTMALLFDIRDGLSFGNDRLRQPLYQIGIGPALNCGKGLTKGTWVGR